MKLNCISFIFPLFCMMAGCMAEEVVDEELEGVESPFDETVGEAEQAYAFDIYGANQSTNNATAATTAQIDVTVNGSETVMIGTTGITGASYYGDTFLRLRTAGGTELASNDNTCGTLGSRLHYKNSSNSPVPLKIWAGCAGSSLCGNPVPNVIGISRRKEVFNFSGTNTDFAQVNTTVSQQHYFLANQTILASTCKAAVYGSETLSGDTMLRLYKIVGGIPTLVSSNDNADTSATTCSCGTNSLIKYKVPTAGFYEVRAGCSGNGSCSGYVAIYAE